MGAGALHGQVADRRVVRAGRGPLQGLIAHRGVRAAGGLVQRLIPDRCAIGAIRDGREGEITQGGVAAAGRVLGRERRLADRDAGCVLVGQGENARAVDLIRAGAGGGAVRDVEISRIVERRPLGAAGRDKQIIGRAALIETAGRVLVEGQRRRRRRACRKLDVQAAAGRADRARDVRRRRHRSPGGRRAAIAFELIERAVVADHAGRRGRALGGSAVRQRDRALARERHDRAVIRRDADCKGRPARSRRQTPVNRVANVELSAGASHGLGRGIADDDVAAARRDRRAFAEHDIAVASNRIARLVAEQRVVRAARDSITRLVAEHGIVGSGGRDRNQRTVANSRVVIARQRIGARAGHRIDPDRSIVRARDVLVERAIPKGGIIGRCTLYGEEHQVAYARVVVARDRIGAYA